MRCTILFVCSVLVIMASLSLAFKSTTSKFGVTRLHMKTKDGVDSNLARKMKRAIRASSDEASFSKVLSPEYDAFLKNAAGPGVYESIMSSLTKQARALKIELKKDFGARESASRVDVVAAATAAGNFNTLLAAATKAGLVDTLKGGLLTVFAPTDEAFAALEEGALDALMADTERLQEVLKHHVIGSSSSAAKIAMMTEMETLHGTKLAIKGKAGEFTVDGAAVVAKDIKCSNGQIHAINTVLMPPVTEKPAPEEPAPEEPAPAAE